MVNLLLVLDIAFCLFELPWVQMHSLSAQSVRRFLRYAFVGFATLSFDLVLLYVLTQFFGVPYYISTPLAFMVAVSVNYFASRRFVFRGTARPLHHGYAYFLLFALAGALAITLTVTLLVTYTHIHYLLARVLVAGVVGMGNYLGNLYLTFKVVGVHHDETHRSTL
jgi:putative flippase GtrA